MLRACRASVTWQFACTAATRPVEAPRSRPAPANAAAGPARPSTATDDGRPRQIERGCRSAPARRRRAGATSGSSGSTHARRPSSPPHAAASRRRAAAARPAGGAARTPRARAISAANVAQLARAGGDAQPIVSRSASARRTEVAQVAQPAASAFSNTQGCGFASPRAARKAASSIGRSGARRPPPATRRRRGRAWARAPPTAGPRPRTRSRRRSP